REFLAELVGSSVGHAGAQHRDLGFVTWEQRAMEGEPRFEAAQHLPDLPYGRYAEMLGWRDRGPGAGRGDARLGRGAGGRSPGRDQRGCRPERADAAAGFGP